MKKNYNTKPQAAKNLPFTTQRNSEHDYSTQMDMADSCSNKRDRQLTTPGDTPEKIQMEKKAKGTPDDSDVNISTDTILKAIESLGKRVDDRMDEVSKQIQQHSTMLAAIAKSVQFNSEELQECKKKIQLLEKEIGSLKKDNDEIKEHVRNQERYKRRWCLRIKGKKEKINENIRAEVVELLGRIAPDLKLKMEEAVDVVHRVGKAAENKHRQIIILFARRAMRDDIWRRTKASLVCKDEGIRFAEDLSPEDWRARQALWPKIDQARKAGKAAGFRGPFGFIEGKRIREETPGMG